MFHFLVIISENFSVSNEKKNLVTNFFLYRGDCLHSGDFQFPNDAYFSVSKLLIYTPMKYQTDFGGESASDLI